MMSDASNLHGKAIKQDVTRRRIYGNESSQESEDPDRDKILEKAFGVRREQLDPDSKDESSSFLAEHRKKEAQWRKQNLG
jgi:hypothetical protein